MDSQGGYMKDFFKDVYEAARFGVAMFGVIFLASVALSLPFTVGFLLTHHF
jgi:hypothetical protein